MLDLSQDAYGTHVIEKIIVCYQQDHIQFIYDLIIDNFMYLANHNNGLCVVKKVIIHAKRVETVNIIRNLIIENAMYLVQNPYGNYVIQIALDVICINISTGRMNIRFLLYYSLLISILTYLCRSIPQTL